MKYQQILTAFYGSPWAILPEKLRELQAFLEFKARGGTVTAEEIQRITAQRRDDNVTVAPGGVAVVPVMGTISQRVDLLEAASGGIGAEQLGGTLDDLARDPAVSSILLQVDSPGGSVFGIPELAAKIRGLRSQKRIVALADATMASAAYWLGAQAGEVYATPSGMVGSVGVLYVHQDYSRAEDQAGVKTTLISSAPYKTEGDPSVPLSADASAELTAKVQHYHQMFVNDLAAGRGVAAAQVKARFGGGRMLTAEAAMQAGMIDGVQTFERTLASLVQAGSAPGRAAAKARALAVAAGQ